MTTTEVLADGYQLAEAPRVADDGSVFFTDVLGGGVYRWTAGEGVDVVVPKRRGGRRPRVRPRRRGGRGGAGPLGGAPRRTNRGPFPLARGGPRGKPPC